MKSLAQSIISNKPSFIAVDNIVLGHNDMAAFEFVVSNFTDNEKDFKTVRITYTLSNCNNVVIIVEYLFFSIIYILIFNHLTISL